MYRVTVWLGLEKDYIWIGERIESMPIIYDPVFVVRFLCTAVNRYVNKKKNVFAKVISKLAFFYTERRKHHRCSLLSGGFRCANKFNILPQVQ